MGSSECVSIRDTPAQDTQATNQINSGRVPSHGAIDMPFSESLILWTFSSTKMSAPKKIQTGWRLLIPRTSPGGCV